MFATSPFIFQCFIQCDFCNKLQYEFIKMKAILFIFAFMIYSVMSQENGDSETCAGPTTNNYYYFQDGSSVVGPPVQMKGSVLQGRPGKIGPQGLRGEKGNQGLPGVPDNTEVELLRNRLSNVKRELDALTRTVDVIRPYPSCDFINGTDRDNGIYFINPDPQNMQSFQVFCNFSGNATETIIQHDSMNEIGLNGCEPRLCYQRKINYEASLRQIVALIESSSDCRQFIKLRCDGVVLNAVNSDVRFAAWISRNGVRELYWGGATSRRPNYCACGETNSCTRPGDRCNCDRNISPETSDEGDLTDKSRLPVIELQFGDTGDSSERGWHTLGPLICSGRE